MPRAVGPVLKAESGIDRHFKEIQRLPMLDPQEEYMLAKRWRKHGDRDAADRLVISHLRLVAKIARGYCGYGLPIADLISEGHVGLLQARTVRAREGASGSPPMPCGGSSQPSRNTSCAHGHW